MARGRIISPEFWTDGKMIGLSFAARLFYIGTWNMALCDRGHLPDDALGLKLKIFPGDDVDVEALVQELIDSGRLTRLEVDGRKFLHIPTFASHQKADTRWTPRCPVCTSERPTALAETPESLREPSGVHPSTPELSVDKRKEEKKGEDRRPASRSSRIDPSFSISEGMREWARKETPLVNIDKCLPEFIDYWKGVPASNGLKADWEATWHNSMRKQQSFAEKDHGPAQANRRIVSGRGFVADTTEGTAPPAELLKELGVMPRV